MKHRFAALLTAALLTAALALPAAAEEDAGRRQCEEAKARYEEVQKAFEALTDKQKAQIYDQNDKVAGEVAKLMALYAQLGVLTQEEADMAVRHLTERGEQARSKGELVGLPRAPRGGCPRRAT